MQAAGARCNFKNLTSYWNGASYFVGRVLEAVG